YTHSLFYTLPAPHIYTLSLHDALPISPRNGVTQIARIETIVPLSMARCGSARRIARPANSEPSPLKISTVENRAPIVVPTRPMRSEEHTSELQSLTNLVCRLLLEKKKN